MIQIDFKLGKVDHESLKQEYPLKSKE